MPRATAPTAPAPSRGGRAPAAPAKAPKPDYRCTECGWTTAKWVGRCGECQEWGSVEEAVAAHGPKTAAVAVREPASPIGDIDTETAQLRPTGVEEFDRVLGGGLVPGAVVLVAGEPGAGKSTLLLDVAARVARAGRRTLYLTGEESAAQVKLRGQRIGAIADDLFLAAETDLAHALGQIDAVQPELVVIDSVQTFASTQVDGAAGGVSQVREVAGAIIQVAKERDISVLLVGHVTKDGSIAGPRVLEHLVDVVVHFEGERTSRLRFVRAVKNRYGPTDEVGCFDMSDAGIIGLKDPSGIFLSGLSQDAPGSCVTVTLEGRRPLATEIQSLVVPSPGPNPRRATSGLDSSRLSMVLAVLQARSAMSTAGSDIYSSTVGGVKVVEPAADLAIALAIASSVVGRPLVERLVALGEVGLSGEVRAVPGISRRLTEAARLGFTKAAVPKGALADAEPPQGMKVIEVTHIAEAVALCVSPRDDS